MMPEEESNKRSVTGAVEEIVEEKMDCSRDETNIMTEEEEKAQEASVLDDNDPLHLIQKKAATVLANFKTGLQLQQQQQRRSKEIRQQLLQQHACRETRTPEESSNDGETNAPSAKAETCTEGVTSTPSRSSFHDDSAKGAEAPSCNTETQQDGNSDVSPTGVLDLPALCRSTSRPLTPVSSSSSPRDETNERQSSNHEATQDLDVPTLQQGVSLDSNGMSPSTRNSFWYSLTSSISPKNENENQNPKCAASAPKTSSTTRGDDKNDDDDDDDGDQEVAHQFAPHTYQTPTKCDICSGLLVGLWCQGLRCRLCGLNVHRGEGANGHTNCRAEALLQHGGCRSKQLLHCQAVAAVAAMDQTNNSNNFTDAIQQVRQMAKERPNFFRDVKAQMDRDLQSRVKSIIVSKGTQEQKSKSLLRLRTHVVVPTVRLLDRIERKGGWLSYGMLMAMHVVTAVVVCGVCWTGLSVASWKTTTAHDDRVTAAAGHLVAINYAFHMAVFASVMVVRRVVFVMHRKSKVLDQFLQEVLSLSAEQDLGISVHQFATRARLWMKRSTATALTMLMVSLVTYRWMHHSSGIAEVMSVADDDEPSWHQCLVDEEMEWDKL